MPMNAKSVQFEVPKLGNTCMQGTDINIQKATGQINVCSEPTLIILILQGSGSIWRMVSMHLLPFPITEPS